MADVAPADVRKLVNRVFPQIRALRRDIHKHPEIGYEEVRTAGLVAKHLRQLKIPHRTKVGRTGVVALIKGERPGKCIALRGDMDALPLVEENKIPYRSVNVGRMHACGHDGHTAAIIGVAHVLSQLKAHIKGSVKLIFQPAEEGGAGAAAMLEGGAFDDPKPDVIYGVHSDQSIPLGDIGCSAGPQAAAADHFQITIHGKGAHAAYPHRSIDPIVIAASVVQALQTVRSRRTDPAEPVVVTIGMIHGGSAANIIPETVTLGGTLRTYSRKLRRNGRQWIKRIADGVARSMGGSADMVMTCGYPPVINDAAPVAFLKDVAADLLGKKRVHEKEPQMGGEDLAFFLEKTKGVFFWLGIGPTGPLHSPTFNFNDDALKPGVLVMSMLALRWLEAH